MRLLPPGPPVWRTGWRPASPHISAAVIEATEFPDLAQRYRVSGVPKTVVDDRVELLGVQPEGAFVRSVLQLDAPAAPGSGAADQSLT